MIKIHRWKYLRMVVIMVSGILRAVIGRGAAAQKSDRCHNQGKEQDAFHGKAAYEVKNDLFLQVQQTQRFSPSSAQDIRNQ
jgi:hypothetical protein